MARYRVTREPGAPIDEVGFVKAGAEFEASSKYVPQTATFVPLDEEALKAMQAAFPGQQFVLGTPSAKPAQVEVEPLPQAVERFASRPPPKRA